MHDRVLTRENTISSFEKKNLQHGCRSGGIEAAKTCGTSRTIKFRPDEVEEVKACNLDSVSVYRVNILYIL